MAYSRAVALIACVVSYPRRTRRARDKSQGRHINATLTREMRRRHIFHHKPNYTTLSTSQTLKHKGKVAKEEHGRQRQEAGPFGLPRWSDGPLHHAQINTTERTESNQYEHPKHYFQSPFIPRQGDESKRRDQPQLAVGHHPYHGQGCRAPGAFSQVTVEILLGDECEGKCIYQCGTVPDEEPKGQPFRAFRRASFEPIGEGAAVAVGIGRSGGSFWCYHPGL